MTKPKFHHRRFETFEEAYKDDTFLAAVLHARTLGQIPDTTPRATAVTICKLEADGERLAVGYSFCSEKEQFSRVRGRQISEGRARKQLAPSENSR
jgi:hypothetical protein